MKCPKCSAPITAKPDAQGYLICAGCDARLRQLRNCPPGSNPRFRAIVAGEVVDRCPMLLVTPLSIALLRRHARLRFGLALRADEPELVARAMEVVEGMQNAEL